MKPSKPKGSIRLTSSAIKTSLVNAFSTNQKPANSVTDLDEPLKSHPKRSYHSSHKLGLDPVTRRPTLMKEGSEEVVFANPLAMLHASMQDLDMEDEFDDAPSPTGSVMSLQRPGGFAGYTPAEIRLFQSINIEESDSEGEQEEEEKKKKKATKGGEDGESFRMRELELMQYRDLLLQQEAAAVSETVDEPAPDPETAVSPSPSASSSPAPAGSPAPSASPTPKKPSFQAAARAIIAGNRLVDALTADVELKSNLKAKDTVESVETAVSKQHLQDTLNKSKTVKIKQRQTLFGVTSAFLVAIKSKGAEEVETVEESRRKIISVGSVPALIDAFSIPEEMDMEYLLEFLATHRFFMTSIKLLQHLINRHNELNQKEDETPESRAHKQVRILKVIRIWLARHPTDFGADSILERTIFSFVRLEIPDTPQHQAEVDKIISLIEQKNVPAPKVQPTTSPAPQPKKLLSKKGVLHIDFINDNGPDLIGDQLALIEAQMFKAIPEVELHNFIKRNEKPTPKLTAFINWSHNVQSWIAKLVVLAEDSKDRVETIKYFIKVAKYCYQIKSYNTLFEVVEALSLSPIQRLVKTWRALPTKYKASWLELLDIVSPSDNYALYREMLRNSQGNELPSFSVYLHDLEAALDGMSSETPDSRVNFYKFHVIGGVLINIAYAQMHQCKFALVANDDVQLQLQGISSMTLNDSFVVKAREIGGKGLFEKTSHPEPMFGVDLNEVTEKFGVFGDTTRGMIPVVLRDIAKYLTDEKLATDGLFRRPGNHLAMMKYKKEIDTTNKTDCLKDAMPLDLAGLFAHFLKELPDPLFTGRLYKQFLAVSKLNSTVERVQAIRMLVTLLPEAHRDTALFVLKFLKKVSTFVKNKMHPKNLAVVFAPSLFGKTKSTFAQNMNLPNSGKMGGGKGAVSAEIEETVRRHAQASIVLELMIDHHAELGHAMYSDSVVDYSRPDGKATELGAI